MTVRERVLASRLVEKISNCEEYAKQLGLTCKLLTTYTDGNCQKSVRKKEN